MHSFNKELSLAIKAHSLIRIFRSKFDRQGALLDGYPLLMKNGLLLMLDITEGACLGGFSIYHVGDVTELDDPAPYATFIERALELKGEQFPPVPPIDLTNIRTAVESAASLTPLITVHRECIDPDVCHIGELASVAKNRFVMREIDPSADWYDEQRRYDFNDITRIEFGGEYERSLALVAGLIR